MTPKIQTTKDKSGQPHLVPQTGLHRPPKDIKDKLEFFKIKFFSASKDSVKENDSL